MKVKATYEFDIPQDVLQAAIDKKVSEYVDDNFEEVVRCKECMWFGTAGCAIQIVDDSDKPSENDFCSFGERKEGNDD